MGTRTAAGIWPTGGDSGSRCSRRRRNCSRSATSPMIRRPAGSAASGQRRGRRVPELLELEVTDGVGILHLKRPPLNILNRALVTELADAALQAGRSPDI